MDVVVVQIPDQGQEHQQVSGRRLPRPAQLRPRARSAGEGRLGAAGRGLPDHLRAARRREKVGRRDRPGAQERRPPVPGDRPRPRRRGDLLAPARRARGAQRDQRGRHQASGVPRDHQARGARGDAPAARSARWPDRRLSGAPRARLPGRLHPVAGAVAQAPRRALGRTRAVGGAAPDLRARERDRGFQGAGILDHPGGVHHAARRELRGSPHPARRQEAGPVRRLPPRRPPSAPSPRSRRAPFWSTASRRSRSSATRRRRSPPRPCSRRRRASSASPPSVPCAPPSACSKASTWTARRSA